MGLALERRWGRGRWDLPAPTDTSPHPCPAECPRSQVYGDCANACPHACAHLRPGTQCLQQPCQPGCACPPGQVGPCRSPRGHGECGLGSGQQPQGPRSPAGAAGRRLRAPRGVPLRAGPHRALGAQPLAGGAGAGARTGQPPAAPLQQLVGAPAPHAAPPRDPRWVRVGSEPRSVRSICLRGTFNCSQEDCSGERTPSVPVPVPVPWSPCHSRALLAPPPRSGLPVVPVVALVPLLGDVRGGRAALPQAPAPAAPLRGGRVLGAPAAPGSLPPPRLR